jgi:hypothetical protein
VYVKLAITMQILDAVLRVALGRLVELKIDGAEKAA